MKSISVILPVYNEVGNIGELNRRLTAVMEETGRDFEVIYVDDGSSDGGRDLLKDLAESDSRIKYIFFRRNYGQTAALQAGFDACRSEIAVTMDSDLQNNPEDIPHMINLLENSGAAAVSGWRKPRKDNLMRRWVSAAANRLISFISGLRLHDYGCTLKSYRTAYVKELRLFGEMHRFIPAYIYFNGGEVIETRVSHNPRVKGKSSYGMERIFSVTLDLLATKFLTTFSTKPIHFFGGIGLASMLAGIMIALYVVLRRLISGGAWISPLFFVAVFLGGTGLIFILMGINAELLIRSYFSSEKISPYRIEELS